MEPRDAFSPPEFNIEVILHTDGSPDTVTVSPLRRAGRFYSDIQIMDRIAGALQSATIAAIRRHRPGLTDIMLNRIDGILQMQNINDWKHAHTEDVLLSRFNRSTISEIFTRAQTAGSDAKITIHDVSFSFWINPLSIRSGRGNDKNKRGVHFKTTKSYTLGNQEIGCAASSITFSLFKHGYHGSYLKERIGSSRYHKKWLEESLRLQSQLEWDTEVAMSELAQFLDHYPEYRIVVLNTIYKSSERTDWKGEEYIQDGIKNIIYLVHRNDHYSLVSSVKEYLDGQKGRGYHWCEVCSTWMTQANPVCSCNTQRVPKRVPQKNCQHCGIDYSTGRKHTCFHKACKSCALLYDQNTTDMLNHRCPIFMKTNNLPGKFNNEPTYQFETESENKRPYDLYAYDIESCIVPVEGTVPSYILDSNGQFKLEGDNFLVVNRVKTTQIPNVIIYRNVFTNREYRTTDVNLFINFALSNNDGRNIFVAHNASGYDSRLIFEAMIKLLPENQIPSTTLRGTKFMRMQVGPTIFLDSMMHLSGSLSSLAKDMLQGEAGVTKKGCFPHLFNREEFKNYIGPLPPDKYFDMAYTHRDEKSRTEYYTWRATWEGRDDWNAEKELVEYCSDDVSILSKVMLIHHNNCMISIGSYNPVIAVSPWHFTTAAGFMHKLSLYEMRGEMDKNETDKQVIRNIANNNWIALEAEEHYFAKLALRGGRTEVRKFYHKATPGAPIKNYDVHSMYPSVQIGKSITVMDQDIPLLYPVGAPHIEIHDQLYFPCNIHFTHPDKPCNCPLEKKQRFASKKPDYELLSLPPNDLESIKSYCLNFDGIIMVDVTPLKRYHPIIPVYDEIKKKCVFSCEPIVCKAIPSPLLKVAITHGDIVTKIYRADRYRMQPSKWVGLLGEMYKIKYYSSCDESLLSESYKQHHTTLYREKFGIDLDFSKCSYRPALKKSSKILINSVWGKHAESVDHSQSETHGSTDYIAADEFYNRISKQQIKVNQINHITTDRTLFKYDIIRSANNKVVRPDLHRGYLPCAVFVPMYGQLLMWNMLNRFGERVIMCDTDSIKYIHDPQGYQVTPGNALGEWEDDGDLIEFASIGLKSYALKYANGKQEIKLKGCCLKNSHSNLINFESFKQILFTGQIVDIPQLSFDYKLGEGISTREFLKAVKFDESILKGEYDPVTFKLYPYNYV